MPGKKKRVLKTKNSETGAVLKQAKGLISVALVFPNTYKAGMSSLGYQTVYRLMNAIDTVFCERVFLPDSKKMNKPVVSCETGKPLSQFDIVAFSISFENDYLNVLSLLKNTGIPLRASSRSQTHPLVMAGGVACFLNPEPLAPFMDLMLMGEAEVLIPPFFEVYRQALSNRDNVVNLARLVAGVYAPCLYQPDYTDQGKYAGTRRVDRKVPEKIALRQVHDLKTIETSSTIVAQDTAFKSIFLIETGRGCHHGCRFCSAGFIYRPPRTYPEETVIGSMDRAKAITGRIGLVSSAVSDHPGINRICAKGIEKGLNISFSSLRVDALSDELIRSLKHSGVKTATIAPEAGSERMRRIINKKIDEAEILNAVPRLVEAGIINLKLYFMVGLPFETDDDACQIVDLTQKIRDVFLDASRKQKKIGTITLSINPFVPKPSTPFQWSPMEEERILKKRIAMIREMLKPVANVVVNVESLRMARINALLSMGDQRMADVMELSLEQGWSRTLREYEKKQSSVIRIRYAPEDPLPWDILETGIKKSFLVRELKQAEKEKISSDCPLIPCDSCGRCKIENNSPVVFC